MMTFVATRFFRILLTVWAAATFVFVMLRLSGDPVAALIPNDLPQEVIDAYRVKLGLDQSFLYQYLAYLRSILQGDFGFSFRTNGPALDMVTERLGATLVLTGTSLVIAIVIGVPLGFIAALNRNGWLDRLLMGFAVFGFAMPNFFLGILLILLFTLNLQWLPSSGFDGPWNLVMPALTLGLASTGAYARMTRSSLLEVLGAPYMETARAKGIGDARRLIVHGLRSILIPLVTLAGFSIGALIAGAIVTETVFAWPGVGRLLVVSVSERDLAVVQLIVILAAATMAIANTLIDIALGVLDPRIGSARRSRG